MIPLSSDTEDEDEEGMERKRTIMRERARRKAMENDILDVQDEEESESDEVRSCDSHVIYYYYIYTVI